MEKERIFHHPQDTYGRSLFQRKIEDWDKVSIKYMQAWLATHDQAVLRRADDNFNYDVSEYFQCARLELELAE